MKTHSSDDKICGTCDHWSGARVQGECGFDHILSHARGTCALDSEIYAHDAACAAQPASQWKYSRPPYLENANCWEHTACGFEAGGENALRHGACPAYPHHGRACVNLENTLCHLAHNTTAGLLPITRSKNCQRCGFFNNALNAAP